MKDINKVILIGTVGVDPEVKKFDGGGMVAEFPLATGESWKDKNGDWQERTEWHRITTSGKIGERVEKFIRKGQRLYIEGNITYQQDKNDESKWYTKVRAWVIGSQDRIAKKGEAAKPAPVAQNTEATGGEEDDLPF